MKFIISAFHLMCVCLHLLTAIPVDSWSCGFANVTENWENAIETLGRFSFWQMEPNWLSVVRTPLTFSCLFVLCDNVYLCDGIDGHCWRVGQSRDREWVSAELHNDVKSSVSGRPSPNAHKPTGHSKRHVRVSLLCIMYYYSYYCTTFSFCFTMM